MSPVRPDHADAASGVAAMLRRAGQGDAVDAARLDAALADLFIPAAVRLDEESRWRVTVRLRQTVAAVERAVVAGAHLPGASDAFASLLAAGLLRDPPLIREVVAAVRQDQLAEGLRSTVAPMDRSDLLARLCACPDQAVALAAQALRQAEARDPADGVALTRPVLERLAWQVAAALRGEPAEAPGADQALAAAVAALTREWDAGGADAAAQRLVAAIDPQPAELPDLLAGALADARPALFVAAVAHGAGLGPSLASEIVLDPDGDRLWLALRALGLDRRTIARVGLLLSEADRRRDVEAFAEHLDAIAAVDREVAAAALAELRLDPHYRAARRALARNAR